MNFYVETKAIYTGLLVYSTLIKKIFVKKSKFWCRFQLRKLHENTKSVKLYLDLDGKFEFPTKMFKTENINPFSLRSGIIAKSYLVLVCIGT